MPIYKKCHVDFLQQILRDEKQVLEKSELKTHGVHAHWSEFAIKNIWNQVCSNELLLEYCPDAMLEEQFPDRDWFWSVLCTVLPVWAATYKA